MADDGKTRVQRHRRHKAGDHSLCHASRCPAAGQVETAEVHDLRSAVEVEFASDRPRLQTARRLVELASGQGQPAVSALTQLDRMVEASRRGLVTQPAVLSERQGQMIESVIRGVLADLRLSPEQQALVPEVVPRRLRAIRDGIGRAAPTYNGPVTIDDEVIAVARQIVELEREAAGGLG